MEEYIRKAKVLLEALPYIQKFTSKTFVIKFGGSIAADDELKESFIKDIILLKLIGINIIIVHGGGKEIDGLLTKLNIGVVFTKATVLPMKILWKSSKWFYRGK